MSTLEIVQTLDTYVFRHDQENYDLYRKYTTLDLTVFF